jgi:hypothetical protein
MASPHFGHSAGSIEHGVAETRDLDMTAPKKWRERGVSPVAEVPVIEGPTMKIIYASVDVWKMNRLSPQ